MANRSTRFPNTFRALCKNTNGREIFANWKNIIERGVILTNDGVFRVDEALEMRPPDSDGRADRRTLEHVEREHILGVLTLSDWKIEGDGGAAIILGMHPNTLRSRIKKLNISRQNTPA